MSCQWQVRCDVDFQEPKTVHLLHLSSSNIDRVFFSKINKGLLGLPKYIFKNPISPKIIKTYILHCRLSMMWIKELKSSYLYCENGRNKVTPKGSNTHSCDHVHQFSEVWTAGQLWSMTLNQSSEDYHSMQHGVLCTISPSWQRRRRVSEQS